MNGSFFSSDKFLPHGHSYLWQPEILWLHAISDFLIFLSLMSVPVFVFLFLHRMRGFQHRWVLLMIGLLAMLCAFTHLADVWTIWHPYYGVVGILKAVTAAVAVATTAILVPLAPKALEFFSSLERDGNGKPGTDA